MVSNTHAEHELRDLRPLLTDPLVNEVVINPDGVVWFERADTEHMVRSEHQMPLPKLMQLSNHLAADSHNKLGPKHPLVSGSPLSVRRSGNSVCGRTIAEDEAGSVRKRDTEIRSAVSIQNNSMDEMSAAFSDIAELTQKDSAAIQSIAENVETLKLSAAGMFEQTNYFRIK